MFCRVGDCAGEPADVDMLAVELGRVHGNDKEVDIVETVRKPRRVGNIAMVGSSHSAGFQIDDEERGQPHPQKKLS